jgi:hypothetical protein
MRDEKEVLTHFESKKEGGYNDRQKEDPTTGKSFGYS